MHAAWLVVAVCAALVSTGGMAGCKKRTVAPAAPNEAVAPAPQDQGQPTIGDWMGLVTKSEQYLQATSTAGISQAIELLQKAEEISPPNNSYLGRTFARAYIRLRDFDRAQTYLAKCLEGGPSAADQAFTYSVYAELYKDKGDLKTAKSYVEKAIKLDPKNEFFPKLLETIATATSK